MNEISINLLWKNQTALTINGARHFVSIGAVPGKEFTAAKQYSVQIAPDYNPTGKTTITARSLKALVAKLNKISYRITTLS